MSLLKPMNWEEIKDAAAELCRAPILGCGNRTDALALLMSSLQSGTPLDRVSLRYNIVHGKLSLKADAMLADFQAAGGKYRIGKRNSEHVEVAASFDSNEDVIFSLTWKDAQEELFPYDGKDAEKLVELAKTKDKRKLKLKAKYATPHSRTQMLWARLVSDMVRCMAPTAIHGLYTPEEVCDWVGKEVPVEEDYESWKGKKWADFDDGMLDKALHSEKVSDQHKLRILAEQTARSNKS